MGVPDSPITREHFSASSDAALYFSVPLCRSSWISSKITHAKSYLGSAFFHPRSSR